MKLSLNNFLWYILSKKFFIGWFERGPNGCKGIFIYPPKNQKNSKGLISTSGDISPRGSGIWTGMAEGSGSYRTAGVLPAGHEEGKGWNSSPLLGDSEMPYAKAASLPGMGVSGRSSLLVHQRNHLPGKKTGKLEQKNESMPEMFRIYKQYECLTRCQTKKGLIHKDCAFLIPYSAKEESRGDEKS